MWPHTWPIFWSVLAAVAIACFLIIGYVAQNLEALNRILQDIESRWADLNKRLP
jgi:hypothetical protein